MLRERTLELAHGIDQRFHTNFISSASERKKNEVMKGGNIPQERDCRLIETGGSFTAKAGPTYLDGAMEAMLPSEAATGNIMPHTNT
jgi:hypothetical protein